MSQYRCAKMKLSNSQLNQLKSATKNAIEVTLRLEKKLIGTNGTNFPHNLPLTDRQVLSFAMLLEIIHWSV